MKRILPLVGFVSLAFALTACGGKGGEVDADIAQSVAATQTKMAWEESVESARQTEEASAGTSSESQTTPEVVHVMLPEGPGEAFNSYVTDFNSIDYADEGITYGDQFLINRYERPFTVEMAEYRGYLDIILANLDAAPPWIYLDVYLAEDLPESAAALYGIELDLDIDGRGDFLVQAPLPTEVDWTVAGVVVREDSNNDVGGDNPQLSDDLPEDQWGDGFDRVVFDSGQGEDPDLAWVRRNPEDPTSIQFAFKSDLTGNAGFLWSVWADEGLRDPALADYNDHFSFEKAGSPYPDHQYYPIQEINLLDSTCRSWYGFEPQGNEVGLCQIYAPGEGHRLCLRYSVGNVSFTQCSDVCAPECTAVGKISESLDSYCEPCTLPE